jgi:hypothetical protein
VVAEAALEPSVTRQPPILVARVARVFLTLCRQVQHKPTVVAVAEVVVQLWVLVVQAVAVLRSTEQEPQEQ